MQSWKAKSRKNTEHNIEDKKQVVYIKATWHFPSQTQKKKKKKHLKKFLIFPEKELSSSNNKKFLYTLQESLSFISENGTIQFSAQAPKIKELHPRKIYYTSGNVNSKKFIVLSKKNVVLIFREMNPASPPSPPKKNCYILGNRAFIYSGKYIQNADIFRNKSIFITLIYLESRTYSEHHQTSIMESFCK